MTLLSVCYNKKGALLFHGYKLIQLNLEEEFAILNSHFQGISLDHTCV